jgi:hypothetical protein
MAKAKKKIAEDKLVLNMTFEQAMKKALNTPLPKKKVKKKQVEKQKSSFISS